MTTSTEKLVTQIKLATDYQTNKAILKEKILTELHLTYNGGMFLISPSLIGFLNAWDSDIVYLEDVYSNPIEINRAEFLSLCKERYNAVMNSWCHQHAELKKIRKA
jgi:hypothetical protein